MHASHSLPASSHGSPMDGSHITIQSTVNTEESKKKLMKRRTAKGKELDGGCVVVRVAQGSFRKYHVCLPHFPRQLDQHAGGRTSGCWTGEPTRDTAAPWQEGREEVATVFPVSNMKMKSVYKCPLATYIVHCSEGWSQGICATMLLSSLLLPLCIVGSVFCLLDCWKSLIIIIIIFT